VAIVGLPPLNGFVSEWMIFRGLFTAGAAPGVLRTASVAAIGLALTGGLALACFTKLHGVVFLGTQRDRAPIDAEAERRLVAPQAVLAALCIAIGLVPMLVVPSAVRAASVVMLRNALPGDAGAVAGTTSGIAIAALVFVGLFAIIWWWRRSRLHRAPAPARATWACAFPVTTVRMQYTSSSYAATLVAAFGPLAGAGHIVGGAATADPFVERIGGRLWNAVHGRASALRRLQTGRLRWYLLYVIAALFGLLLYLWLGANR
jgi:NADH:ubiquinone oxidoreductase subunit 5 (subunit L)/multisubunit Na+/H+ antiporter MnhA subunit